MTVAVCTDSGAQLSASLADRWNIEVVPLTVTIDGVDHLEGVDLDADGFWRHFEAGATPQVQTAAPSPGRVLQTYRRMIDAGATEIVSVHTGSDVSATLDAVRLAASEAEIQVEIVDTGSASFVVGLAAIAAAEAVELGRGAAEASATASKVAAACGNVFIVGALDLARAGGRLAADVEDPTGSSVPVLRLFDGKMDVIGEAANAQEAITKMVAQVLESGTNLRVGIAVADPASAWIAQDLRATLAAADPGVEILEYRVGPSVGAHTGPGTAGAVYHPRL